MAALSNDIYIGSVSDPLYHYDNARLELGSAKGTFALDVIGNELYVDTWSFVVRYDPDGEDKMAYFVKSPAINMWDEEWENGYYSTNDGLKYADDGNFCCKNLIPVQPNTQYYFKCPAFTWIIHGYDLDKNYLGSFARFRASGDFTTLSDCYYISFNLSSSIGQYTTYQHDISINNPSTDHDYHAYEEIYVPYITANDEYYIIKQPTNEQYLKDVPFGTPVWWYIGGVFTARGYLKSVERIGKIQYKLTCISGVGLLEGKMHKGGLYTGETLKSIAEDIIGSSFICNVHTSVRDIPVYGHLPYDTARNNLHRLLFAEGVSLRRTTETGDYTINYLGQSFSVIDIPASRIALGGRVNEQLPATRAEITEHAFFSTSGDETVTLFDNTGGGMPSADHQLVVFDKSPVRALATTGTLTINESNCNYAIVTGVGTLTGKLYTHTTQIISLENNNDATRELVKRVESNELVSAANSRNVAQRILGYYQVSRTVKAKIAMENEWTGRYVRMLNAYGGESAGVISKLQLVPTSIKGAEIEFADGYLPTNYGNNYTNRVVLTRDTAGQSVSWSVPAGVTNIRIVLVQGGSGGSGGYDGADGLAGIRYIPGGQDLPMDVWYTEDSGSLFPSGYTVEDYYEDTGLYPGQKLYYVSSQPPSDGGAAGAGGAQGMVAVYDKTVIPGEIINCSIGQGGVGGAANGGAGTAGTHTTALSTSIGSLSSANGGTNGYYDPLSKQTYGIQGKNGYKGGHGGTAGTGGAPRWNWTGHDGGDGMNGGSAAGFAGGQGGAGTGYDGANYPAVTSHGTVSGLSKYKFYACGSGGGGAAYGNFGQPGGTYSITEHWVDNPYYGELFYGFEINNAAGGAGADAIAPNKASYGNGGQGGNGGGGGGNASGVFVQHAEFTYNLYAMIPGGYYGIGDGGTVPAPGGLGSVGGDGGDGCVIIYY